MRLLSAFTEVLFESSFLFEDGRTKNSIVKKFSKKFPQNQIDNNGALILMNSKDRMNCIIQLNKVILNLDKVNDVSNLKTISSEMIPFILTALEVNVTKRIGVRARYVDEGEFSNPSKPVFDRFFKPSVISLITDQNQDMPSEAKVGFTLKINNETNLNFRTDYQYTGSGELDTIGNVTIKKIEKSMPLIDLDVYTETPKEKTQLNGVYKFFCETISAYSEKVWDGDENA